jgi:hypothetical protein
MDRPPGSVQAPATVNGLPQVAAAGLAAAAVMACAIVVVLRSVLFGGSDPRSPFVRFMLLTCVLTGAAARRLPSAGSW